MTFYDFVDESSSIISPLKIVSFCVYRHTRNGLNILRAWNSSRKRENLVEMKIKNRCKIYFSSRKSTSILFFNENLIKMMDL